MKDTKEIILYFKESTLYQPLDVAKEMSNRYPELGRPLVLPKSDNSKVPLILFNENGDFKMQANYTLLSIVVNHNYFDHLATLIFDMVDTLSEFNCEFERIGYISNIFLSPKYVALAKEKFLNIDALENIDDINIGWHKVVSMKYGDMNCWERFITDETQMSDLLCQYDFNSISGEKAKLDMKYIKEFLHVANDYIEGRINYL